MRKTRMHCPECGYFVTQEVKPNAHNGMRYYPVGHKLNPTEEEIHSFDRMRLCNYCLEEYRTVEMSSKQLRKILEALKNAKSDLEKSKRESGRLRHQLTEARLLAQKIGAIGQPPMPFHFSRAALLIR